MYCHTAGNGETVFAVDGFGYWHQSIVKGFIEFGGNKGGFAEFQSKFVVAFQRNDCQIFFKIGKVKGKTFNIIAGTGDGNFVVEVRNFARQVIVRR